VTTKALTLIEPRHGLVGLDFQALWQYRELLYFLVWREVKVRYKQTVIGIAWAVLRPVLTMLIFTVVFGHFAAIPSEGLPYALFAYTALLPWSYFAEAVGRSGVCLVGDANLLRKVYFPRLVIPLAAVLSPVADFAVTFVVLIGMMAWYGVGPTRVTLVLPLFLALALCTALAMGLWLSALHVRYRDVGHTIPVLIQMWMYASPIAYPVTLVPERWRVLYGLNPMVGVVEGFRWGLLGRPTPDLGMVAMSTAVVMILLIAGLAFFRRMERSFADVV
jgi:lipopolysaccharide transport system permease protein